MNPMEVYERYSQGREWSDIEAHLPRLREAAKGNVLEIGVRGGISTAALLVGVDEHGGCVISVDVGKCTPLYSDPKWKFIQGHSVNDAQRILEQLPPELDVLFIDSEHSYETTRDELRLYAPLVKKGGVILLHDTDLGNAGVRRALDEYAQVKNETPVYHAGSFGLGELRR